MDRLAKQWPPDHINDLFALEIIWKMSDYQNTSKHLMAYLGGRSKLLTPLIHVHHPIFGTLNTRVPTPHLLTLAFPRTRFIYLLTVKSAVSATEVSWKGPLICPKNSDDMSNLI